MALPDLSKLILYSPDNSFKNVNKYPGSLSFPTSLTGSQVSNTSVTISLSDSPVFLEFFANFLELLDAINGIGSAQWYSANVSGGNDIGIHVTTAPHVGWIGCSLYSVVSGSTVTVTGTVINPYSSTVSLDPLTIPFVFIDYDLAN